MTTIEVHVDEAGGTRLVGQADQRDLFNRVVASVALGNTDDHLRNHGFLADRGAWTLSPAFDVNPTPDLQRRRAMSILGADTFPDEVEAVHALGAECGLAPAQARERLIVIASGLASWPDAARAHGIASREIALMAESITPRLEAVAGA